MALALPSSFALSWNRTETAAGLIPVGIAVATSTRLAHSRTKSKVSNADSSLLFALELLGASRTLA
jgi:hypothetical protein